MNIHTIQVITVKDFCDTYAPGMQKEIYDLIGESSECSFGTNDDTLMHAESFIEFCNELGIEIPADAIPEGVMVSLGC